MANWESLIGAKIEAHRDTHTVCNPITRQLREHIENTVLEKYTEKMKG